MFVFLFWSAMVCSAVLLVTSLKLGSELLDYKVWYDQSCQRREELWLENLELRKANGTLHTEKIDALNKMNESQHTLNQVRELVT